MHKGWTIILFWQFLYCTYTLNIMLPFRISIICSSSEERQSITLISITHYIASNWCKMQKSEKFKWQHFYSNKLLRLPWQDHPFLLDGQFPVTGRYPVSRPTNR